MECNSELEILNKSEKNVIIVIVGILISLSNIREQKRLLVCGGTEEEAEQLRQKQLLSNGIIIIALIFFFCITKSTAQESNYCDKDSNNAYYASTLSLMAGIVRYIGLLDC